jgi:putative phosphoesterase
MENKKLLVISDTHGNTPALKRVFDWAKNLTPNGAITTVVFLGDGLYDLRRAADAIGFFCDWKLVRGNNDYEHSIPEAAVFDFNGHRFFMCHGNRHSLYGGYHTLIAAARNVDAEAALFGHTHIPCYKTENGILLINPGSVGSPRSRIGATFAVIECAPEEALKVQFFEIGAQIRELEL